MRRSLCSAEPRCESQHSIDLAWLKRHDRLITGAIGTLSWSLGERQTGSIRYRFEENGLRLLYRVRTHRGDWREVAELIAFGWSQTKFGGRRQWFHCPNCLVRCRVVYGRPHFDADVVTTSVTGRSMRRAIDRAERLRKRVGGIRGAFDQLPFPEKRKGMHWRT